MWKSKRGEAGGLVVLWDCGQIQTTAVISKETTVWYGDALGTKDLAPRQGRKDVLNKELHTWCYFF